MSELSIIEEGGDDDSAMIGTSPPRRSAAPVPFLPSSEAVAGERLVRGEKVEGNDERPITIAYQPCGSLPLEPSSEPAVAREFP